MKPQTALTRIILGFVMLGIGLALIFSGTGMQSRAPSSGETQAWDWFDSASWDSGGGDSSPDSSGWDWGGDDNSSDSSGWDSGGWDSGSWDSGGWDDSGSWDSGGWDSGSWDSGGSDSGSW